MRYFLANNQEIYAYNPSTQNDYINNAISLGYLELTVKEVEDRVNPKLTLEELKQNKLNEITFLRNNELDSLTCEWNNDTWDARETDSTRITNVLTMIEQAQKINIPTPPTVDWRTYDDQDRTLTIPEMIQLAASMFMAQQIVWAKQAQLKNQVLAAATEEEINQINW